MKRAKNKRILFVALLGFILVLGVFARDALRKDFMSPSDARKRWGHEKFDPEKFKNGDTKVKASMAASLIESKSLLNKPLPEVKDILGEYSGHYWNDDIPTYIIEEGWRADKDTWQLVFLPDKDRKVKEIKIHKNCCDRIQ